MIGWADRVMIAFPLWLDGPPPALHDFLHHAHEVCRKTAPAVPFAEYAGRNARVIITMQFPAFLQRSRFRTGARASVPAARLPGVTVEEPTFIGSIDMLSDDQRARWLDAVFALGAKGS
jgi:putative NADPH-quinone reductase